MTGGKAIERVHIHISNRMNDLTPLKVFVWTQILRENKAF